LPIAFVLDRELVEHADVRSFEVGQGVDQEPLLIDHGVVSRQRAGCQRPP